MPSRLRGYMMAVSLTTGGIGMKQLICSHCGTVGTAKTTTSGSILIELVLWCCFIVPGIIYSLWRLTTRRKVCRACSAPNMIPLDSPIGRKLQANMKEVGVPPPLPKR
jgi:hypothetical protein